MAPSPGIIAVHAVPALMSLVALARLPYAYYMSLRVVVFVCGLAIALLLWTEAKRWTPWIIAFVAAAAIFNPIIPVRLSREVWIVLNVAAAGMFLAHLTIRLIGTIRGE